MGVGLNVAYSALRRNLQLSANASVAMTADPTKTLTLRRQFITDINNRFTALKRMIRVSIVDNDCFGLKDKPKSVREIMGLSLQDELDKLSPIKPNGFRFVRSEQKVEGFLKWLQAQQQLGILEITAPTGKLSKGLSAWSNKYVTSSYQKGLSRARSDLIAAGTDLPAFADMPGGLNAVFYQPFHADAVGLIHTRVYRELEGITAAMDQQIARELSHGLVKGEGPYQIAKNINDRVDNIGINRARTLARTEVTQTFNTAMLNEYESAEKIIREPILVEWWTAGDSRVRPAHVERHGEIYKREEAYGMIGEPNCRCTLLPYIKSVHGRRKPRIIETDIPLAATDQDITRWIPAENIADAKKQLKNKFKLNGSLAKGFSANNKLPILNSWGAIIAEEMKQNPGWAQMVKKRAKVNKFHLWRRSHLGDLGDESAIGMYRYRPLSETNEIHIASAGQSIDSVLAKGGKKVLQRDYSSRVGQGAFTTTSNNARGVFAHEWGHHLQRYMPKSFRDRWDDMMMKEYFEPDHLKRYINSKSPTLERKISKYAGSDFKEAFAESFASFTHPRYKDGNLLPGPIHEFFEDLLKVK